MKKRKYLRKLICIMTLCIVFGIIVLSIIYFAEEPLRNGIKKRMSAKVINNEERLTEVMEEFQDEEIPDFLVEQKSSEIYYRNIDNDKINWAFSKFHPRVIAKSDNNFMGFYFTDLITYSLWGNYEYGFYYSIDDEPRNALDGGTICEKEFKGDIVLIYYNYKTEKITDNWWFYEVNWEYPPIKR